MIKEYKIKDNILNYLASKTEKFKQSDNYTIAKDLNLDLNIATYCCLQIIKDGYAEKMGKSTVGSIGEEFDITLKASGETYIKFLGGYAASERRLKNSKTWKIIMNIILTITACATVIIGMRQCTMAKQANELQRQIDTLKSQ